MAICITCKTRYIAYDEDAGTYKEHFCSEDCEAAWELEVDREQRTPKMAKKKKKEVLTKEDLSILKTVPRKKKKK